MTWSGVAPSILSADFARLGEQVEAVLDAGATVIHVDVMDGHFVPPITMGPLVVEALAEQVHARDAVLDVHLMIERPERYLHEFAAAGADGLTVHVEATPHVHRALQVIRDLGKRAGVTLNPGTPLEALRPLLPDVETVLVMSVNPGFGGQKFIPQSLTRIRTLRDWLDELGSAAELEVDGGVSPDNARALADAGATVLVAGSSVFGPDGAAAGLARLRDAL